MDTTLALPLLGGLTPEQFMKRHWQKKPLLVRQAVPGFSPLLTRAALFDLAGQEGVESRLLSEGKQGWKLRSGPIARRALPPVSQPHWTLLVQGVDLHDDGIHAFMQQFRFVPDARLDDLMISYASDQGGVGPHFDSYDVFLFQAAGKRRWRIGRQKDLSLVEGLPLKILANFEPEHEYVLEPGDMLYLPPRWAHDGVALGGDCMTYSIGFRQPSRGELARELLTRTADEATDFLGDTAYRDPTQPAVSRPAEVPAAMLEFARDAVERALSDPAQLAMALGEALTEPKTNVWFEPSSGATDGETGGAVVLDRRTRMMYDERHVFINGESYRAGGRDARAMRALADNRTLDKLEVARLSADAIELVKQWKHAGWLHFA
ncbi:JmjC domain-containing protein [Ottowia thiooxydans]|uniref:JmjC domain-containing protein n=1 Tax=Ottowia thiooxydans TaxID=219182 RepID=UPI00048A568D|nr:cupin domain-containing protein [Ottowia thiooxydans]